MAKAPPRNVSGHEPSASSSDSTFEDARASLSRAGVASYFIQVSTEDYVEDRLLKDCEDDGRLTLSAKQLERFRRLFVPQLQKEDYQDFCRLGQFERMDISRRLYNLGRPEHYAASCPQLPHQSQPHFGQMPLC